MAVVEAGGGADGVRRWINGGGGSGARVEIRVLVCQGGSGGGK
jgi:hypothetical protein